MGKEFETEAEALQWMRDSIDDPCIDNERLAYTDDPKSVETYNKLAGEGCCGYFDETVIIKGREALVGCNYGH